MLEYILSLPVTVIFEFERLLNEYNVMSKKKKSTKEDKEEQPKKDQVEEENEEREYGGIPERNLKKNLGCGG